RVQRRSVSIDTGLTSSGPGFVKRCHEALLSLEASGVTAPWSRVFRERAIYSGWDNSLIPRKLAARTRDLARHFASFVRLARCNDSCAWITTREPWNTPSLFEQRAQIGGVERREQ